MTFTTNTNNDASEITHRQSINNDKVAVAGNITQPVIEQDTSMTQSSQINHYNKLQASAKFAMHLNPSNEI